MESFFCVRSKFLFIIYLVNFMSLRRNQQLNASVNKLNPTIGFGNNCFDVKH